MAVTYDAICLEIGLIRINEDEPYPDEDSMEGEGVIRVWRMAEVMVNHRAPVAANVPEEIRDEATIRLIAYWYGRSESNDRGRGFGRVPSAAWLYSGAAALLSDYLPPPGTGGVMRLPRFGRPEQRAAIATDAIVNALLRSAQGSGDATAGTTAALEIAAGTLARAFASASVTPAGIVADAMTPAVLADIGRGLIRDGESLHLIEAGAGSGITLRAVSSWTVKGGADPASWRYECMINGPSSTTEHTVAAAGVVHCRYASRADAPWRGVGPLEWAAETGRLAGNLERVLADETGQAVGAALPMPKPSRRPGEDDADAAMAALRADLVGARGKLLLVETTSSGFGEGRSSAPASDWQAKRFGADPPATLATLRTEAAIHTLAACGAPATLLSGGAGAAGREGWRQYLHGTIVPLARLVVAELRVKLEVPALTLDFDALMASDLSGRARAFQSMVGGGMEIERAAGLARLMEPEDG